MSRKTVKDLDVELCSLKEEFVEVKTKLETLLKKYEDIEKKCSRIENFPCDEMFSTKTILLKHKGATSQFYQDSLIVMNMITLFKRNGNWMPM